MTQKEYELQPYVLFGIYAIVGIIARIFTTLPCGLFFDDVHHFASLFSILFVMSGIGWGLHSFFFPKKWRPRLGQGVISGLGLGFGGTTVVFLLFPQCV